MKFRCEINTDGEIKIHSEINDFCRREFHLKCAVFHEAGHSDAEKISYKISWKTVDIETLR